MKKDLNALLEKHVNEVEKAADVLRRSYEKCKQVTVGPGLSEDRLESFEALTARFAMLSDLLIQKALRTMDSMDLEYPGTIRDRINRAEKRGIIDSAETLVMIRMLRNEIAHEYSPEGILEIFENVLSLTPELLNAVDCVIQFHRASSKE
jgi:uncharacterized protein YutE (UPF0331/DUF86 family)